MFMALPPTTTIPPFNPLDRLRAQLGPRSPPTAADIQRSQANFLGDPSRIATHFPHLSPFLVHFIHEVVFPMLLPQDQVLEPDEDTFLRNALEGKLAKVDDATDYLSVLLPSKLAIDIMAHISPRLQTLEDSLADLRRTCSAPPPAPPPAPAPPTPKPPAPRPPKAKPAVPALAKPTPAKATPPPSHQTGAAPPAVRHSPAAICAHLNAALAQSSHQVTLSAARWTAKNNLVVVAGPDTTAPQLTSSSHFLTTALGAFLSHDPTSPLSVTARENVRWSRLTVNGLPTGASAARGAFTPQECHASLLADNPVYRSLRLTQPPSWVRRPDSYGPGSLSSLVVAFEDPDGSALSALLASRVLYAFGSAGTLKRWKSKPRAKTPPS
ncbi:hypothetical protein EDB86DRAFT_3081364 [Lactarius hatsudake]|nr:hypothetical protein EDB86DRAFT_3081364 [Lactarius hatsudake]